MNNDIDVDFEHTMVPPNGVEITLDDYDGFKLVVDNVPGGNTLAAAVAHVLVIKTGKTVVVSQEFIRRLQAVKLDVQARKITIRILPQ